MLKKEIRLNFIKLRNQLTSEEADSSSRIICDFLHQLPIWDFEYYHIFLPIIENNEVDTYSIIDLLKNYQKKIVVPKIKSGQLLEHYILEADTSLKKNHWGIPEPESGHRVQVEEIDLVFVPMLAFDRQGHRVGYGKGYYDRFLASCRASVVKIGLCFFEPIEKIGDAGPQDISMDYCITPEKIYEF
ncbi:MAG: 5-formyltetrahydrofolate cyclo-ligase [Flavobacteriaceae bacterium]